MDFQIFITLLSSILMVFLGLMLKFSVNDGWSSYKKYWLYFIIIGSVLLIYNAYKYLM